MMKRFIQAWYQFREKGLSEKWIFVLFCLPTLTLMGVVFLYPTITTGWYSLHRMNLVMPWMRGFVGFTNYVNTFANPRFWNSLTVSLYFVGFSVTGSLILGIGLALFINKPFKGKTVIRVSILVPWALAMCVVSLMWKWMYNDQFGVINAILMRIGIIEEPVGWFQSGDLAIHTAIFTDIWRNTPFVTLLLLTGLQVLPQDLYEAAKIDGASIWQRFIYVTLPLWRPVILVTILFRTIGAFNWSFDLIYPLTRGGPGNATEVMPLYVYTLYFRNFTYGVASTVAIVMASIVGVFAAFYVKSIGIKGYS